ncbi:VOC family protein [Pusillimonas noertemannii]|uniref:Catechol-2,3-dioxygenase n=1 Tax=Pusillimonas noertemannii TaxID=305977 RepID=A0A2U1CNI3_9BURK|nr:VOC family protein [Pusillimonas noertemannii]NYT68408.1 VOC family protein [Pusillimonas noertemannii]PVY62575.1 catechol-2,3-dioxygenase [Pusillimonas noertemannii]TFL10476.1 bleomycin resistance protein [Pusillimonas noertemannii]
MNYLEAELDHMEIGSPDPERLAGFYAQALQLNTWPANDRILCEGRHRRMVMRQGEAKSLHYLAFRLPSLPALAALRSRIEEKGVAPQPSPSPFFDSHAFMVSDPDGNRIVFGHGPRNGHSSGLPARLQHLALGTTHIEAMIGFYTETLGLRTSDNVYADGDSLRSTFLRAGNEHHVVAIFKAARNCFDHHCYEAGSWDLIRDWADHLATHDIPLDWGPGRHGPGDNLFFMIRDPDQNWLEISAELELCQDDRPTGSWQHCEKTLNSWGKAYLRS